MKLIRLLTATAILMALAIPAWAADCIQSDGQPGVQLVGVAGDAGCQTADEYAAVFSVDNLVAEGILTGAVDNGDGTVTVTVTYSNATTVLVSDPLDRPVAATPSDEPDAPTVREVLYSRPAFGVQPI